MFFRDHMHRQHLMQIALKEERKLGRKCRRRWSGKKKLTIIDDYLVDIGTQDTFLRHTIIIQTKLTISCRT